MTEKIITFDSLANGTTITAANSGFTSLGGSGTLVATTTNAPNGGMAMLYTPVSGSVRQAIYTYDSTTNQTSVRFTRRRSAEMVVLTEMARVYAGSQNTISIRQAPDGKISLYVLGSGTAVYTSTGSVPVNANVVYSLWANITTSDATIGQLKFRAYLDSNLSTPISGIDFSSSAVNMGVALFSGVQLVRPGSSTDVTPETWDSIRIRTSTDAVAMDTAAWPVNVNPTMTVSANIAEAKPYTTYTTTATAVDTDGTIASYSVNAPGLTLTGTGNTRTFTVPMSLSAQSYSITWTATDNSGGTVSATQTVTAPAMSTRILVGTTWVPYARLIIT